MFVLTLNKRKGVRMLAAAVGVIFLLGVAAGVKNILYRDLETSADVKPDFSMSSTRDMARYALAKGYTVDLQSAKVNEVRIPKKFDGEFENFNEKIKRTDGLSLEKLKNKKVDKWTFDITDYPVRGKGATAVLLVRKDKLVGAYILQTPEGIALPMETSSAEGDRL